MFFMYPNQIFLGLGLYDIMICLGIILCLFSFSYLSDCAKLKLRLQKFSMIVGALAISLGFGSAILFQAFYNIESAGKFEIVANTGATFYGGLIGGVTTFIVLYFCVGGIFFRKDTLKGYHSEHFFDVARCAMPSIAVAHGFGRLGCLFAGCCHGAPTESWIGIMMYGDWGHRKYVPVQLFEALYLLFLFGLLFLRAKEGKKYNLSLYVIAYGVWRFFAEYLRRDYRGSISFTSLTPSQFIAVLMVVVGICVIFLERAVCNRIEKKKAEAQKDTEVSDESVEAVETAETVEADENAEADAEIEAKEDENE